MTIRSNYRILHIAGGGQWKTSDGVVGDLVDGVIRPFQSFFARTAADATSPSLDITQSISGGAYYGRPQQGAEPQAIRLQAESDELQSSSWLRFSEAGTLHQAFIYCSEWAFLINIRVFL